MEGTVNFLVDLDPDPDLRILSHNVPLVDSAAPYGAVDAGSIRMLGRIRRASWVDNQAALIDAKREDTVDGEALAHTRADTSGEGTSDLIPVWCLQICPYSPTLDRGPSGLILTTDDETTFRRIGKFEFDLGVYRDESLDLYKFYREKEQKWADGCELREVIIE